jgi:C4-dicarboxylate-specific signal transduction histidine kinase
LQAVLSKLEQRRFIYRKKIGLGRNSRRLDEKINILYDFHDLKEKINNELDSIGIAQLQRDRINKIIIDREANSNKAAEELKQAIAQYQGQATVGKIVNVILHEGRKPLGYFKNQIPLITEWKEELKMQFDQNTLDKIIDRLAVLNEQSDIFIKLFAKLDPLSAKKRDQKKEFNVNKVIENVRDVFSGELHAEDVLYEIDCLAEQTCYGWKEDLYIVLTNLVDNSLHWLRRVSGKQRKIDIRVYEEDRCLMIEYRDNGPGIEKDLIESEVIFEPEFSGKTGGGTGLGLAISGEAIARNDGSLKAIYSDSGAFFKIQIKMQ